MWRKRKGTLSVADAESADSPSSCGRICLIETCALRESFARLPKSSNFNCRARERLRDGISVLSRKSLIFTRWCEDVHTRISHRHTTLINTPSRKSRDPPTLDNKYARYLELLRNNDAICNQHEDRRSSKREKKRGETRWYYC